MNGVYFQRMKRRISNIIEMKLMKCYSAIYNFGDKYNFKTF